MPIKRFNLNVDSKISPYNKIINIDSDKSISIRSFLIGAICLNISSVKNVLESEDVFSTIKCLKKLGVKIRKISPKNYLVYGNGLGSLWAKKNTELNFGNSGTLARLLVGILSTTPGLELKIKGDNSLNNRNMKKLIELMSEFGAFFLPKRKLNFPLRLVSTNFPIGIKYTAGVSAQLKSAVMLAGLNSYGNTEILEKKKSRNHTENILKKNKDIIKIKKNIITISGKKNLPPLKIKVPGDPSSAAFFTALTLLNKKSCLTIRNVGLNSTRLGFYEILKNRGAKIKFSNLKKENSELRGDIVVRSSQIKPIKVPKSYYVTATDEYPLLFIISALTNGTSIFKGIDDLANKESNRIIEMQKVLRQVGITSIFKNGELKIFGQEKINPKGKVIDIPKLGDHRICMSSFILSILTGIKAKIRNFETVYTSSPSFLKNMKLLGVKFEKKKF